MVAEAVPDRLVGGRYRLLEVVGVGGFGRVWRALDQVLQVQVALKEVQLPPAASAAEHAEHLAATEREARAAARLRGHPNIVDVLDVVIEDDRPWIVLQFVDGRTLAQVLDADGPLPAEAVAGLAAGLLQALGAAHAAGIVHRDVKPPNIMLDAGGTALLADFGIAVHSGDATVSTTRALMGTLEYLPPERLDGDRGSPAGDLYSLGLSLYQAVEGHSPFRRETPTATMAAVMRAEVPAPVRPARAGRLTPLLAALLAKDPAARPTVPAALALLEPPRPNWSPVPTTPWAQSAVTAPVMPTTRPRRRRGRRTAVVASVIVLLGGAAGAVAFLLKKDDAPTCSVATGKGSGAPTTKTQSTLAGGMPPDVPHPAVLQSPADLTTLPLGDSITLTWTGARALSRVALNVNQSGWTYYDWQPGTSCTFTPGAAGTYTWMVATTAGADAPVNSTWSEWRDFVVQPRSSAKPAPPPARPAPPTRLSPADQATAEVGHAVTLTWSAVGNQSELAMESPDGTWKLEDWQADKQYVFTPATAGVYVWDVFTSDQGGVASGASEQHYLVVK